MCHLAHDDQKDFLSVAPFSAISGRDAVHPTTVMECAATCGFFELSSFTSPRMNRRTQSSARVFVLCAENSTHGPSGMSAVAWAFCETFSCFYFQVLSLPSPNISEIYRNTVLKVQRIPA